jgi:hypothetical protein
VSDRPAPSPGLAGGSPDRGELPSGPGPGRGRPAARPAAPEGRDLRFAALAFAALGALVFASHREALGCWFASDDFRWLEISEPGDVLRSFVGPWGHGPAYRPLSRVSFLVDHALFGLNATGWHAHGLLLHATAATLLAVLLRRLSGDRVFALAAAAVFAVFPLGYENSIWISGRIHPLGLCWSLAALVFFDRVAVSGRRGDAAAFLACYAMGLLAYEASVYVPAFAVLVALARRPGAARRPAVLRTWLAALALTAVWIALRSRAVGGATLYPMRAVGEIPSLDFAAHVAGALRRLLQRLQPAWWALVAATLATAWAAPRRFAALPLGAIVALLGFAPFALVLGGVPARFLYASQLGIAIAVGALVAGAARIPRVGGLLAAVLAAAILWPLATQTDAIARDWRIAGQVGRRVLDDVETSTPPNAGPGITVLLGAPYEVRGRMVFSTYLDAAMRVFHPGYPRLVVPGQYFLDSDRRVAAGMMASTIDGDAARRAALGRPAVGCVQARQALDAGGLDAFASALAGCGGSFLAVTQPDGTVRAMDPTAAAASLRAAGIRP